MKVIMSVLSSQRESEGVCVSPCALAVVVVGFKCPHPHAPLLCEGVSQNSGVSLFPPSVLPVIQQGVNDFESLIQNFRKTTGTPSRELSPYTPSHNLPLLRPAVTN